MVISIVVTNHTKGYHAFIRGCKISHAIKKMNEGTVYEVLTTSEVIERIQRIADYQQ